MINSEFLRVMSDGTVKQRHPISGNEVWTVPGRGNRPLGITGPAPQPVDPAEHDRLCAFCHTRYLETPPEKTRLVLKGGQWRQLEGVRAEELFDTVAEFRCIPNLFEILSYDYWHLNHGYELDAATAARRASYLSTPAGREHVLAVQKGKLRISGLSDAEIDALGEEEVISRASGFFGGGHDVVVARRHLVDGATDTSQLASSGTLTVEEHRQYIRFTISALQRLLETMPRARHVAVFQNWLKPAGASFDHLHKQLVAIDEYGGSNQRALTREIQQPGMFNTRVIQPAIHHDLVLAQNDHAIAIAGFGHRYPTIKVLSTSEVCDPWLMDPVEVDAMSDLVHAMHAATGADVPCNEEWHQRPHRVGIPLPWYINIKWRVSTLAGFEGGTKINVNTISPTMIKERLIPRLMELRERNIVSVGLIGDQCRISQHPLRYTRPNGLTPALTVRKAGLP